MRQRIWDMILTLSTKVTVTRGVKSQILTLALSYEPLVRFSNHFTRFYHLMRQQLCACFDPFNKGQGHIFGQSSNFDLDYIF